MDSESPWSIRFEDHHQHLNPNYGSQCAVSRSIIAAHCENWTPHRHTHSHNPASHHNRSTDQHQHTVVVTPNNIIPPLMGATLRIANSSSILLSIRYFHSKQEPWQVPRRRLLRHSSSFTIAYIAKINHGNFRPHPVPVSHHNHVTTINHNETKAIVT